MTTQTLTLAEFLLARIAEDETGAGGVRRDADEGWISECGAPHDAMGWRDPETGRVWQMTPERVLAECRAKRGIVRLHDSVSAGRSDVRRSCPLCQWERDPGWGTDEWPCETLLWLAAPYAAHPDFRDEWSL